MRSGSPVAPRPAWRAALGAGLLVAGVGLLGGEPAAQVAAEGAAVKTFDEELIAEIRRIAEKVEALRAERFTRPVTALRLEASAVAATEGRAGAGLAAERVAARGRAWDDLGVGDPGAARRLLRHLAADLEGVAFSAERQQLLVAPELLTDRDFGGLGAETAPSAVLQMTGMRPDEPVVAHALVHALQGQRGGGAAGESTTDRLLAARAWAEGEANLLAMLYVFGGVSSAAAVFDFELDPRAVLDGALVPPLLDDLRGVEGVLERFVWIEGYFQTLEHFRAGGWDGVARAAATRQTTRGVLHRETAPAPGESEAWPSPAPPGAGLVLADEDSLGEQVVVALVSAWTGKDNLGLMAGDGWAGDRVWRWEPAGADPARGRTQWVSRWRDEDGARDFVYAARRTLEGRYGNEAARVDEAGVIHVTTPEREHTVRRDGTRVEWLVHPPSQ